MAEKSPNSEPPKWVDPVTEFYKKDIDRTLIRENLKLTPQQRIEKLESMMKFLEEAQQAMKRAKAQR
jgi:hypothetical protein